MADALIYLARLLAYFVVAVLAGSIASSIFSTQFVVSGLQAVNVDVPFATRLMMTITDLAILQTLGGVVAACYLVGFLIANVCHPRLSGNRIFWYTLAGAAALVSTLLLMGAIMQLAPVAGARTVFGLLAQAIAGAIGGAVFARLTQPAE